MKQIITSTIRRTLFSFITLRTLVQRWMHKLIKMRLTTFLTRLCLIFNNRDKYRIVNLDSQKGSFSKEIDR